MYLSNTSVSSSVLERGGGLAEQAGEHGVLAPDLLAAVDLEGVLHVPVPFVLAGEVAAEAALLEDRDDPVVGDRVLRRLVDHLVELGLDMPDEVHVREQL